jgi:hypothetical protein
LPTSVASTTWTPATMVSPATGNSTAAPLRRPARVRALDERAQRLLECGLRRSPTFRSLVDTLEHSDLVVHVGTRSPLPVPGRLAFSANAGGVRYVRISLWVASMSDLKAVSWFGHELQHAVEVAAARQVGDPGTLAQLYERIGIGSRRGGRFETRAAQDVASRIFVEAGRRGAAPAGPRPTTHGPTRRAGPTSGR